jgi:Uma2 family endonuclease
MSFAVAELELPVRIRPLKPMSEEELLRFCAANEGLRIEREPDGELVIMTPAGGESNRREVFIARELDFWAEESGNGVAYGSTAGFNLPDGSMLSPDAAWVSSERWLALTPEQRERLLPFCPDFVVEVLSRSDSPSALRAKMEQWMRNGAQLGWLFDPYAATLAIYRPGKQPEILHKPDSIEAEAPIAGFRLTLGRIWA